MTKSKQTTENVCGVDMHKSLHVAAEFATFFLEKPNTAFAKFSRVLRGRVLPSSKPGAIQSLAE